MHGAMAKAQPALCSEHFTMSIPTIIIIVITSATMMLSLILIFFVCHFYVIVPDTRHDFLRVKEGCLLLSPYPSPARLNMFDRLRTNF